MSAKWRNTLVICRLQLYSRSIQNSFLNATIFHRLRYNGLEWVNRCPKLWHLTATSAASIHIVSLLSLSNSLNAPILGRSHTFVEVDNEILSTVILIPSSDLFMNDCCQLQAKVYARSTC